MLSKMINRFYNDYCLRPRINEYEQLIEEANNAGYSFETLSSFDELIQNNTIDSQKRMVIRCDVDTKASSIMKQLINTNIRHGVRSTTFFRDKTIMREVISDIVEKEGGIASYHYETIALYAEKHRIHNVEALMSEISEIRDCFSKEITMFRKKTGQMCQVVASHGDFINIKLGISNTVVLSDGSIRELCGITREAYDIEQMKYVTCRVADHSSRDFCGEVKSAINRNEPVIYMLIHPRQWGSDVIANTCENASRLYRGVKYSVLR